MSKKKSMNSPFQEIMTSAPHKGNAGDVRLGADLGLTRYEKGNSDFAPLPNHKVDIKATPAKMASPMTAANLKGDKRK